MKTLFLKIFLWFWLAIAALLVIVVAVGGLSQTFRPDARPEWAAFHASLAQEAYEAGGKAGLLHYAARVESLTTAQAFLFDTHGNELSGRTIPEPARDAVRAAVVSGKRIERRNFHSGSYNTYPLTGADGRRYVFVRLYSQPRPARLTLPTMGAGWLLMLGAILTAGLVCYWLARYLTSPIRELTLATQRLAEGDLTARVGSGVQNRRDELADLGRHFNHMAERLESMIGSQRELLRNVSHELRSPLARLNVALGLARQHADADGVEPLDRIERESERLNDLIGRLLMLSRLEAGLVEARLETIELENMVRSVADDASFEAGGSGRQVTLQVEGRGVVKGNPEILRSALENVVRNAVRHSPANSRVELSLLRPAERTLLVRVRDHGAGVPDAAIPDLFRPFYRLDVARAHDRNGAGLGLAIAQRAVQLHGGRIEARNHPDGGLCVEITLPMPASVEAGVGIEPTSTRVAGESIIGLKPTPHTSTVVPPPR